MARPQLIVTQRALHGSRAVRRMRREGLIPGIVYGKATEPIPLVVSRRDLIRFLHAQAGEHGLLTLRIEADASGPQDAAARKPAGKTWEKPVLIKHVEHDPVGGQITHIDFHAITLTEHVRIKIPLVLKGEPVGVKQDGGVMEHFLREIEVECLPTAIPKQIEHDVSLLKIGDAIHVRELAPPEGAKVMTDLESVIASVLAPKEEKIEEAAAAVAEPEVIREKKPEAEEEAAEGKAEKKEAKAEKPEAKEEKREKEQ